MVANFVLTIYAGICGFLILLFEIYLGAQKAIFLHVSLKVKVRITWVGSINDRPNYD